ncbi:reverse transcriptase domain-containing protein [Tanacetum coccineum]|uniref:Reverse transcriptase domain-containing protein n=1 Tax=Tanacetum coccineum TaxID=301880 RepID=A0ABQ4YZB6_9ASTR
MRTRNSYFPNNSNVTILRRRNKGRAPNIVEPELRTIVAPMAERTMEELLRAPTEGYGEAIVLPEINADHFEIKTNLLQLVQANPFYGRESENPHAHINSFKRITSTLRFRNVPNDVIKLMMFPYSLEGAAKTWYEKEPPNSILTWEDLVTKFVNQFFPPSKTTHLKNEISRFTQKFEETFSEAWERFKELLRACPHHGFTELTQVDTFYNGLNENEQDSLNAAAGGNLLSKTTREALNIIENKSKVRYSRNRSNASRMNATSSKTDERIDKLADQLSTLVEIVSKKVVTPAPVKAVEETCVTCGGAHSWYNCPATDNNQASVCATTGTYNQVNPPNRVSNQMAPPGFAPVQNNGQNRFNQNQVQGNNFNRGNNFHVNQGFQNNHAPHDPNFQNTWISKTTFSIEYNQVQQEEVERETEETTDKEQSNFQGSIAQIPPPVTPIPISELGFPKTLPKTISILEPDVPKSLPKPHIPYPSRLSQEKSHDKASNQKEKIFQIIARLDAPHKRFPKNLGVPGKFLIPYGPFKQCEVTVAKSSLKMPPELELNDFPYHFEYAYLEETDSSVLIGEVPIYVLEEGIVLSIKFQSQELRLNRAKVIVIAKYLTRSTVKKTLKKKLTEVQYLVRQGSEAHNSLQYNETGYGLPLCYAFETFLPYLVLSIKHSGITDHSALLRLPYEETRRQAEVAMVGPSPTRI